MAKVQMGIAIASDGMMGVAIDIDGKMKMGLPVDAARAMADQIAILSVVASVLPFLQDFFIVQMELSKERSSEYLDEFVRIIVTKVNEGDL